MVEAFIKNWLLEWQSFIRNKDYHSAMYLFSDAVFSFGTVSNSVTSLEGLIAYQWKVVWERTTDFTFDMETMRLFLSCNDDLVVVAIQWFGKGVDGRAGQSFSRRGRASIVLQKEDEKFLCIHSHFSINPDSALKSWSAS